MNVFIGCSQEKGSSACKAEDMYTSTIFKKSLIYAKEILKAEHIYILSAKYFLLPLNKTISPYNRYLGDYSAEQKKEWADEVIKEMKSHHIDFNEKTIFLCGEDYYGNLESEFSNCSCPFKGRTFGFILKYLKNKCKGKDKDIKEGFISLYDYIKEELG